MSLGQVDDMRMAMDGLEREVETMAEKMAAMEDRLKEQRRIIAMLEDSDISTGGTLTKSRKTTAARIHRDVRPPPKRLTTLARHLPASPTPDLLSHCHLVFVMCGVHLRVVEG